jgi:CheY-like chemotaxis protein
MKSSSLLPVKILLVDDSRDGLLVRRALLEEAGYQVEMAGNGEEGLKLYDGSTYAVVVTDYRMPRMNGLEMISRIRMRDPNARVVLISSCVEPLGLNEENTGADAVIAKSAKEPAQLLRAVKRLANRASLRKPASPQRNSPSGARASGE